MSTAADKLKAAKEAEASKKIKEDFEAKQKAFEKEKATFEKEKAAFEKKKAESEPEKPEKPAELSDEEYEELNVTTLVVNNSRPSAVMLPPVPEAVKLEEQKGLMLMPGQNDVSKFTWQRARDNATIKLLLGAGILKNLGEGKANPILRDWTKLSEPQGLKLIAALSDIPELNKVKAQLKSKNLVLACEARIEEVIAENEAKNG